LPNFFEGTASVQDSAAQLAADLLNVEKGQRVLDVCAAPGGKTAHILEASPDDIRLTAIDIDDTRNQRVIENLERLKLNADVLTVDGLEPNEWFDDEPYQRILLDAPCSATGVIRRHPDIKLLRKPRDITALVELQAQILDNLWKMLKPGGVLLYATCSILKAENEFQIADFLHSHDDASEIKIDLDWGMKTVVGKQQLPSHEFDGFYYAKVRKNP